MKNRKTLSIFICTLLLSSCFIIKTENTNNFTTKELLYRAIYYGVSNTASFYISNNLTQSTKQNIPLFIFTQLASQTIALELLNNYGPDKTYIEKVGKMRFASSLCSAGGFLLGSEFIGGPIGMAIGSAIFGTTYDLLINKAISCIYPSPEKKY